MSNVIEGSLVVSVTNIDGQFELDPRSHILKRILLSKEYEPEVVELIAEHTNPGRDAINIGANIGLYTNLLANLVKDDSKVLAIEPTPNAYKLLRRNIERNGNSSKVVFFNGIATDTAGKFKINVVPGNEEYSSIGEMSHRSISQKEYLSIDVEGATVDALVKIHNLKPGILVIDVEGAEFHVLKGARETLNKYHPVIITELDDNLLRKQDTSSKQIISFLDQLGYTVVGTKKQKVQFPFEGNVIAF